jgi:SPP1 gp7 family putative phage head morphogenesis protein
MNITPDRPFGKSSRNARRILAGRLRVPAVIENRYALRLRRIVKAACAHIRQESGIRHDSAKQHGSITVANVRVQAAIRRPVSAAFDEMHKGVERANRLALNAIPLASIAGLDDKVREFREWNISLISDTIDDYAHQIREILDDQESEGLRVEVLADRLRDRAGVSDSRAELIARDQTLKINAQINESRQTSAGISQYTWSTSHDERVRDSHRELDGEVFSWDDPPEIDGEPLNPGEDFQCRCIAIPVFDETE